MKQTNGLGKSLESIALAFALVLSSGCDSYVDRAIERKEQKAKQEQLNQEVLRSRVSPDWAQEQQPYDYIHEVIDNTNISINQKRVYLDVQRKMIDKYDLDLSKYDEKFFEK